MRRRERGEGERGEGERDGWTEAPVVCILKGNTSPERVETGMITATEVRERAGRSCNSSTKFLREHL